MNFTISRRQLRAGLDAVKTAFALKKDQGSILGTSIKVQAAGDSVTFLTSNGETFFKWKAPEGVQIERDGSCVANAEKLLSGSNFMGADNVQLEYANDILYVKGGKVSLEVKTVDESKMPEPPLVEMPLRFNFDSTEFFKKVLSTMGRDVGTPRMLGMLFDFKSDGDKKVVTIKASQRNRVSRVVESFEGDDNYNIRIIVPCFLADEASKRRLLAMGSNKSTLSVQFDHLVVTTSAPEDIFVGGDEIFDIADGTELRFSHTELSEAMNFFKSVSDKQNRRTKFDIKGGTALLSTVSDTGKSKMEINCECSGEMTLALNSEHLSDLLPTVDKDSIALVATGRMISYKEDNYHFITSLYAN